MHKPNGASDGGPEWLETGKVRSKQGEMLSELPYGGSLVRVCPRSTFPSLSRVLFSFYPPDFLSPC